MSSTKRIRVIKNTDGLQDREEGMKKTGSWSQRERYGEIKNSQRQQGTERRERKNKDMEPNTEMAK